MADVQAEPRMLIDGKLVDAASGKTFANVNPATEEVIGEVADGGADDMEPRDRAPPAGPSTRPTGRRTASFRKRCLQQLKDALDRHREDLRPQIVAEVGTPIALTYAVQLDSCIDDMQWDIDLIDSYEWEHDLPVHEFMGMTSARRVFHEPIGVVRRDHAVELPVHAQPRRSSGPRSRPATPSC